ncbi:TPA: response regulator [Pseudomonas aeruginosa]
MTSRKKIVLADDHAIVLLGLREILEKDPRFLVVGEASTPTELVTMVESSEPDIVITDYCMPEHGAYAYSDGVRLIEYLCRNFPRTRVLVFTMLSNTLVLSRLYELGVAGVVHKSAEHDELLMALAALRRGRVYRSKVQVPGSGVAHINSVGLTLNELEVLRDFVMGLQPDEIAIKRKKSVKTISAQKLSAMRKLGVDNNQMLMDYCIKARIFE